MRIQVGGEICGRTDVRQGWGNCMAGGGGRRVSGISLMRRLIEARTVSGKTPPVVYRGVKNLHRTDFLPVVQEVRSSDGQTGVGTLRNSKGAQRAPQMGVKTAASPPTLTDVARLAGVGRGTASRALNDAEYVKEKTAERVRHAAELLGYRRNELARSLKVRHSEAIGIVMPDIGGSFMATIIRAALGVFRENRYISVLAFTDGDPDNEAKEIDYLLRRQIDALLVVPSYTRVSHFQTKELAGIPIVAFDQPVRNLNFDAVLVKNKAGAYGAVKHLIEHGYQRIACIGVNRHLYSIQQRIDGYRQAVREAHLPETISVVSQSNAALEQQLLTWLNTDHPPRALFCLNDFTSQAVLEALELHRARVPDQVAVVGFDDVEMGKVLATPFTAVVQPAAKIGEVAASLLMDRIRTSLAGRRQRITLDVELVIRKSCGCK